MKPTAPTAEHHPEQHLVGSETAISLPLLRQHFHLPLREAARRLGVCEGELKRICRTQRVARWPYRQVSTRLLKIEHLVKYLAGAEAHERPRLEKKIRLLQREYMELVGGSTTGWTVGDGGQLHLLSTVSCALLETQDSRQPASEPTAFDWEAHRAATSLRFILDDSSILDDALTSNETRRKKSKHSANAGKGSVTSTNNTANRTMTQ
ncbi:TPA: hypothetical protein N0F65_010382 [Lagenidium giganteum]|uniref:RWP-RK domain-containing protein n=1 Tax=Lagenidium giganteum TaxID=4803 RepID=A0AAV2YLI1_9STRA|nr:TPA: hypothetical protein N0F65_010382 [Lagenidium giganteum]